MVRADKSKLPGTRIPFVKISPLSVNPDCSDVPFALLRVRLFRAVMFDGTIIPALVPAMVMDETPVALSWVGVPAMALFSVKVCAPTAKPVTPSDASKLSVPCTSMLPPMLTPPVRLAVRSYKSAM